MKSKSNTNAPGACRLSATSAHLVRAAVLAAAIQIPCLAAHADTLLWYRFDGNGATVENKANPGTMDGTLKSMNTWGSVGSLVSDTDTSKFPTRGDAFPEGTVLIDPTTDVISSGTVKSLSFTGNQATAGVVLLTKANAASLVNLTSFTCEVFFKIPASAASRTPALFPLVTWGEDQKQGWKFGFFQQGGKLSPWFRGVQNTSAGAKGTVLTINAANGNKDNYTYDTWHHLAFVVDGAGDGSTATAKLILDYTEIQTLSIASYYGFYFNSSSAFPFIIGADIYRNKDTESSRETFMGDIAEFRISDTALAADELLRPLPAGPVDADTLVYLPMGDCDWFGSPNTASYKNVYHGVLNAAPTAACTPHWTSGTTSTAYPASAADAAGASVRDGYFASDTFADAKSMTFSRALVSGQYAGHVLRVPYENAHLAEGSFTMEWFFKTDGQVPSGNEINSYTFLNNQFAKIMINQSNGYLLTRLVKAAGGYEDFNTSVRVDDGAWHHYALVYDIDQGAFSAYLDYGKITSKTYTLTTETGTPFYFGGQSPTVQAFAGQIDDFRITKRAMKAGEFLTSRSLVSGDSLFAHFDGDLSTGQDTAYAPDGVGGTLGGGSSAPTFVDRAMTLDLDGDERSDLVTTKALRLDGGSVVWPHNSLLECRDFTVEWFAKYESLANNAMLLRLGMDSNTGAGTICWALFAPSTALQLAANTSADGSWKSFSREDKQFGTRESVSLTDGMWHHWALVAESHPNATPANTTFTLYKDYERVGNPLVFDKNGAGGMIALPSTGTTLSIGTGSSRLKGEIDELRFRPGAQPVSSFMRKLSQPFVIVVR